MNILPPPPPQPIRPLHVPEKWEHANVISENPNLSPNYKSHHKQLDERLHFQHMADIVNAAMKQKAEEGGEGQSKIHTIVRTVETVHKSTVITNYLLNNMTCG